MDEGLFDTLSERYPSSAYITAMHAIYFIEDGKFGRAEDMLSRLSGNTNTFTLTALGLLHDKKGQHDEALTFFQRALGAEGHSCNEWLRLYLYEHFKNIDPEAARQFLDEALVIEPRFNRAIVEKAFLLSPIDQCDSVITILNSVSPSYKESNYLSFLGDAYYFCGYIDRARWAYTESNEAGENGYAWFGLGEISREIHEDLSKVKDFFEKAVGFEETKCDAMFRLLWINADMNHLDEAEAYAHRLIKFCPSQESYNEAITYFLKFDDFEKAEDLINLSQELYSRSYFTEGLRVAMRILRDQEGKSIQNRLLDAYYREFGDEAANWLSDVFYRIGDNSSIGVLPDKWRSSV